MEKTPQTFRDLAIALSGNEKAPFPSGALTELYDPEKVALITETGRTITNRMLLEFEDNESESFWSQWEPE